MYLVLSFWKKIAFTSFSSSSFTEEVNVVLSLTRSKLSAVLVFSGGQMVTLGKLRSLIGRVEMTEDTGFSDQS